MTLLSQEFSSRLTNAVAGASDEDADHLDLFLGWAVECLSRMKDLLGLNGGKSEVRSLLYVVTN